MMKRRHFNLIKTGRKSKLALAVGLALAMSAMGSVYASGNDDTFKNFANKDALMKTAEGFKTQEFKNSTGLEAIGANKAYALGYSGENVNVAMIDKDLPYNKHKDLLGKVTLDEALFDYSGNHPTHVAGIIAAKKSNNNDILNMHGVAYNANIFAYHVLADIVKPNFVNVDSSALIVNESFGPENFLGETASKAQKSLNNDLVRAGRLIIHAAGNMGKLEWKGLMNGYKEDTKNGFIGVSSINSLVSSKSPKFLNYDTNLAGGLKKNFIVAPGNDINSTFPPNGYKTQSGTSMAAPYVTGTAALIQEACPYITGKQIGDIILSTANNKFELAPYYFQMQVSKDGTENGEDRYKIDSIRQIFIKQDGTKIDSVISEEAIGVFYDTYVKDTKIRHIDKATFIRDVLNNADKIWEIVELPFEEVFGQGIVDAGKAVQGLGAIDVDRLSKDDITTKYSNDKFYMYKVDTKKVADNFRGRNYSIWSNDIGDKNVTGINAGLEKTGDVKLILLGENTYGGATVAKGGFLQIVRGVGGDVYVGGDSNTAASAEINGYAKNIYALESGKVKISDIVSKNYANLDADFLAAALPDTNKVDINGGLFAIGKNSITGEGSTINVNLTRSDSAIKGALYQDELGKINLSLANEAKFILQQGTGYYAGNSYKSNDTINNLRMDSFATFDMSQDGVYSTLKIDKLQGRDGQFILGTDLANCKGDSIFVTGSDAGEHWISIVDKNGIYADNEDGAKKVLVATTPDNVEFKGLALAQDMGVNQYNFTPNIYYDENIKGWYFDGFRNEFAKPEVDSVINKSGIYTTDNVFNNGIYGNGAHYLDGSWKETAIKVIKGKAPYLIINKTGIDENIIGVSGAVQFLGDGPVNIKVENNDPMKSYIYGTTTGLKYRGDHILNANQDMKIDVKSYNDTYGIDNFVPKRYTGYRIETTLNFNGNLDINLKNTNNAKTVAIINNREININKDLNINVSGGYANGISNVPEGKLCVGGNVNITTDGNTEGFTGIRNGTTNNTYDDETDVHIDGDLNVDLTHSKSKSDVAIKNTRLGNMLVKGNINVKCVLEDNYSIENSGVMTVGKINSDSSIKNNGTIKTSNGIFCNGVLNNVGGDLELSGVSKISRLYNLDKISGEELTINELVNSGGNINIDELTLGKKLNNTGNIEIQGLVGGDNTNSVDISGHGAIYINQNKNSMVKFVGAICNDTKLTMNLVGKE